MLDAVLDLFDEDCLAPSAQEVADRSGVSLRSVYRYYQDLDELVRAAIERNVERAAPQFIVEGLGEGPLGERIDRIVARRLALYESMGSTMRAALLRSRDHEVIREQVESNRRRLLKQVQQMFDPELRGRPAPERREIVAALDLLLGFESLEHLRRRRGMSGPEARRVLVRGARSLLEG